MQQNKRKYKDNKAKRRSQKYIERLISQDNTKLKQKQQEEWKEKVRERNLKIIFGIIE